MEKRKKKIDTNSKLDIWVLGFISFFYIYSSNLGCLILDAILRERQRKEKLGLGYRDNNGMVLG